MHAVTVVRLKEGGEQDLGGIGVAADASEWFGFPSGAFAYGMTDREGEEEEREREREREDMVREREGETDALKIMPWTLILEPCPVPWYIHIGDTEYLPNTRSVGERERKREREREKGEFGLLHLFVATTL